MLALVGEILLLSLLERKRFQDWVTPFTILSIPYGFIICLTVLFSEKLGFIAVEAQSIILWIIGLAVFWFGGRIISTLVKNPSTEVNLQDQERLIKKCALIPAWIAMIMMTINFSINANRLGGLYIATSGDIFANIHQGILSLSKIASMAFTVMLVGTTTNKKYFTNFTIFCLVLVLILYQVKGDLLIPLIGGLIFRLTIFKPKLKLRSFLLLLISGYIIFNIFYLFVLNIEKGSYVWSDVDSYKFLFRHFVTYLFSGPLALSETLQSNNINNLYGYLPALFTSLINLFRHINGTYNLIEPVRVIEISNYSTVIDLQGAKDSNVHTFIGTIIVFMGWFYGLFYIFILGMLSYFLYIFSRINIWVTTIYSLIAGALFFGWFEYYFWHSFFILIVMFVIILCLINIFSRNFLTKSSKI